MEIGPFKHTVDDGLDIRKSAFECMYTLLDTCLDQLDIFTFLNYLEQGLKDHYDIKMLSYLMLIRLAQLTPNAVFQSEYYYFGTRMWLIIRIFNCVVIFFKFHVISYVIYIITYIKWW